MGQQVLVYYHNTMSCNSQVKICNIVCTFNLGLGKETFIDLRSVAQRARNVEYKPKRFPAIIMRIKNMDQESGSLCTCTALIFSSGRIVVAGNKSGTSARVACKRIARIMQKLGYAAHFENFKIQNVVGSLAYGNGLRLATLCQMQSAFCRYEPELFPGLHWKIYSPKYSDSSIILLIFASGKIVITGARNEASVYEQGENICNILNKMGTVILSGTK